MPRHPIDTNKITFATGAAGGTIAYRPNEVLIRNLDGAGAIDLDLQDTVNLALDPDLDSTEGRLAGSLRALVEWLRGVLGRDDDLERREQQLGEIDEQLAQDAERQGVHVGPHRRLRFARSVNDRWSVFVPAGDDATIDPVQIARVLNAAGLTAQPNYVRFINSLQSAPNYIAPNYIAPNYIAPNYIAPNYIAPNYIAPNYIAPNYIAPNYIASGGGAGACRCEPCPDAPHVERKVPMITARGAYGPLPGPPATKLNADTPVEIHVLDVRFQAAMNLTDTDAHALKQRLQTTRENGGDLETLRKDLDDQTVVDGPNGMPSKDRRSGLLPLLLRFLQVVGRSSATEPEIETALDDFLFEPKSKGLGANVNDDEYVDPTTNHAEFIQGIIDRIVVDHEEKSVVRHHAVAGTLGDVDDADLALSIDWVVSDCTPKDDEVPKLQIMNLSLSGYTDDDLPDPVLADSIEAAQQKKWLIIASAGNNGSCRLAWPAALKGVVSVAAYGPCGPAFFSNYGPWVDACGPGVDVVSDFTTPFKDDLLVVEKPEEVKAREEFAPNGKATGYASWSGTSFSAPYVAAMLALRAVREINKASGLATVEAAPETEAERESRVAKRWRQAIAKMISHPDLIRFPTHGTIVSSEAVKVTQNVKREKNAP